MVNLLEGSPARWGIALTAKLRLLVVGAGGHGRTVAEAAELSGQFEVVGFLDDSLTAHESVLYVPILGIIASIFQRRAVAYQAIVAMCNNILREKLSDQVAIAGFDLVKVVHPCAIVSTSAMLGAGCAETAGSIIGTETRLGVGSIVNCGAVVPIWGLIASTPPQFSSQQVYF